MLTLVRYTRTEKAILGSLYLNGAFVCYTLENASKAIPAGLYTVQNSKSPKFKRELPLLTSDKVSAGRLLLSVRSFVLLRLGETKSFYFNPQHHPFIRITLKSFPV